MDVDVETLNDGRSSAPSTEPRPSTSSATLKGKTKDASEASDSRPPPTPSPDRVKCGLCLGYLINQSYSNTCVHQFCFSCLLEWSKMKPECPLCKSQFRSIFHNIRSIGDFDEYVVPTPIPHFSLTDQ